MRPAEARDIGDAREDADHSEADRQGQADEEATRCQELAQLGAGEAAGTGRMKRCRSVIMRRGKKTIGNEHE